MLSQSLQHEARLRRSTGAGARRPVVVRCQLNAQDQQRTMLGRRSAMIGSLATFLLGMSGVAGARAPMNAPEVRDCTVRGKWGPPTACKTNRTCLAIHFDNFHAVFYML